MSKQSTRTQTNLFREHELPKEPCPVSDVVVLVVLGQVEHILAQQLGLFGVGNTQLGSQVHCLEFDNVILGHRQIINPHHHSQVHAQIYSCGLEGKGRGCKGLWGDGKKGETQAEGCNTYTSIGRNVCKNSWSRLSHKNLIRKLMLLQHAQAV